MSHLREIGPIVYGKNYLVELLVMLSITCCITSLNDCTHIILIFIIKLITYLLLDVHHTCIMIISIQFNMYKIAIYKKCNEQMNKD